MSVFSFMFGVSNRKQKAESRKSFITYSFSIAVLLAIAMIPPYQANAQATWQYNGANGNLCDPNSGNAWWEGRVGIRTQYPTVPLHIYSGYCVSNQNFFPAIERLQTDALNYSFGQSSIQFWSGEQNNYSEWQVSSIKPITNSSSLIFQAGNPLSSNEWYGGLAFYCSGVGQRPQGDGAEVMRLYDRRVAVNSTTALGRFDIRVGLENFNPRFVFGVTNSGEYAPALKIYSQPLGGVGEFGNALPIWMVLEPLGPTELGTSQFHIMSRGTPMGIGQEIRTDMTERLTVVGNGNVGINEKLPGAKFQVTNGSVLFQGYDGGVPKKWNDVTMTSSQIGPGTRMMWIPAKSALRAGKVNSNQWDDDYYGTEPIPLLHKPIGFGSIAFGENVKAEGNYSSAIGYDCLSLDSYSFASGQDCQSEGYGAVTMGWENRTFKVVDPQQHPTRLDPNTVHSSFALGHHSYITGSYDCMAMGFYVRIKNSSIRSVAMGRLVTIDGAPDSFVFGSGQNQSTDAAGESYSLLNNKPRTFMVGFNSRKPALFVSGGEEEAIEENTSNVQQTSRVGIGLSTPANTLDVRGKVVIGSSQTYAGQAVAPNNGLIVEGKTVIGTTASSGTNVLTVNGDIIATAYNTPSDRNLKKNITDFTDGLTTIRQINTVRFHYNGKLGLDSTKEHIGILAQDIEKIAPYAVHTDTIITREAIKVSGYIETDEIDTTDGGHVKKLRYVPAEIREEKNSFLAYNPSVVPYLTINAIKQLDSTVAKLEEQVESLRSTQNTNHLSFAKVNDPYLALEQRIQTIENKLIQLQSTCCKNTELYDDVLLEQNIPNPFSKETIITYYVPERLSGRIELIISDVSGNVYFQKIPVQTNIPAQYLYSPTDLQTGVYLYGISLNGQIIKSKKMMIIR